MLDLGSDASLAVIERTQASDSRHAVRAGPYLLGFGSVVVVVLSGVLLFGAIIGRRIAALNRTAHAVIDGDLSRRVPDGGSPGAFDRQARTVNRMLDRIKEIVADIGAVTGDVAHDLRAPLARLRGQLGALVRESGDERTRDGLSTALAQCDEVLATFTSMLRIAEIEGAERRSGFVQVDIGPLIGDVATIMEPVAIESGHVLIEHIAAPSHVQGDRRLLTQALINLVENAIHYTPAGSHIVVSGRTRGRHVVITVTDDGPGIPSDDHQLALRQFGRLGRARDRDGHGLGLPMVQAIARLHRGSITLRDACPGLSAIIELPLDEA